MRVLMVLSICALIAPGFALSVKHTGAASPGKLPARKPIGSLLPDIIDLIRPSLVRVAVRVKYDVQRDDVPGTPPISVEGESTGTGFIINDQGCVATAAHVVDTGILEQAFRDKLNGQPAHIVPGSFRRTRLEVLIPGISSRHFGNMDADIYNVSYLVKVSSLRTDVSQDIALLRTTPSVLKAPHPVMIVGGLGSDVPARVPKLVLNAPRDGEMIGMSGFPLGIPVLTTNVGWIATAYFRDERQRSLYLGALLINHGDSGGPVYLATSGGIIGMATEYRPAPEGNSGLTVIVPVDAFLTLLQSSGSWIEIADAKPPKSDQH